MKAKPTNSIICQDLPATLALAKALAQELLQVGDLLCLLGELGAGKTTFVRGLAAGLGIDRGVHSPTFALLHEYRGAIPLYHFDFYRLQKTAELDEIAFYDYLGDNQVVASKPGVVVVEWADRFEWQKTKEHFLIRISTITQSTARQHSSQQQDGMRRFEFLHIPESRSAIWSRFLQQHTDTQRWRR